MSTPFNAVFLSYASEDAQAAQRIAEALRAGGIEVWFDREELRGGDAWDRQIRRQIHECALFVPVISAHSDARHEGYFRREWRLAVERAGDMAEDVAFLLPVVIDNTSDATARVPDRFREVQWSRLPGGEASPAFVERVLRLLSREGSVAPTTARPVASTSGTVLTSQKSSSAFWRTKPALLLITILLVVALGYFAVEKTWLSKRTTSPNTTVTSDTRSPTPTLAQKSIAVLPFADMSQKKDQDYFADGMAEEILDILAKIPRLTVIGRTSSFQFKGRTEDLRTIGEKLGAAYVVEGSVRKAGDRIRVTAQLIDTQSGTHVWSQSYDKDYGNVLTLQDEIATAIARALQLTIGARGARPLRDELATEAYTLYLRARLALDKFGASSLLEAQSEFQQALQLDPTLLPAAEGLALTYLYRGLNENDISGRDAWEQARSAARKALQISASSSSAHGVLGYVTGMQDFDWATAEKEFRTALTLNPNDVDTLTNAAQLAAMRGDFDQAMRRINTSLVLDPLNPNTHQVRGLILYMTHDYSAAESALQKSIAINPEIDASHLTLAYIHLVHGRWEAALKEFTADPESSSKDIGLALVNHALGKKKESDAALARVVEEVGSIWAYGIACIHAYRGERDQAFEWLEKSRAARDGDLFFVRGEPLLASLHDDPRWAALMKSMNLPN